jgi:hypothetical protein
MSLTAAEAGFPHTFSEILGQSRAGFARVDHRLAEGWRLPPTRPEDPLSVTGCAWHTLATDDAARAVRLFTDILGGQEIGTAHDVVGGGEARYIAFADTVMQIVPQRTPAPGDKTRQDVYDSITLQVRDLAQVRCHLASCGVALSFDSADLIRTDPRFCIGATWGFTTRLAPGDLRPGTPSWSELVTAKG